MVDKPFLISAIFSYKKQLHCTYYDVYSEKNEPEMKNPENDRYCGKCGEIRTPCKIVSTHWKAVWPSPPKLSTGVPWWLSVLGIWCGHCCGLCHCFSMGSIPGSGMFTCRKHSQKKKKKVHAEVPYDLAILPLRLYSKEGKKEKQGLKHILVHHYCSIIDCSQKVEIT